MTRDQFINLVKKTPNWKQCPQSLHGTFKRHSDGLLYRLKCNPLAVRLERQWRGNDGTTFWLKAYSLYYGKIRADEYGQVRIGQFLIGPTLEDVDCGL